MKIGYFFLLLVSVCWLSVRQAGAQENRGIFSSLQEEKDTLDRVLDQEMLERLRNMPNIEVGKGITFEPRNKLFKMTMRFRMQNLVGLSFDDDFHHTATEARVKRLRLRFDGYIFTEKLLYSIQLGFTPYDARDVPNGNKNIVRDAMVYYMPTSHWSIGFGQTKIKANRARLNSSSALQFVDRSIVNAQFNPDRDFGLFGEYFHRLGKQFDWAARASVTLGEGRNWAKSDQGGLAYAGRLELYPMGRFSASGEVKEGDVARESTPKLMLGGAYVLNDRAVRLQGQNGAINPGGALRTLHGYFFDMIFKYRGFAFYTDVMGRKCSDPLFDGVADAAVYAGQGLNFQASYLFPRNWEVAVRNSTLMPERKVREVIGYKSFNQSTLGVTRYLIGHNLKVQADASFNHQVQSLRPYNRWEFRLQVELGL